MNFNLSYMVFAATANKINNLNHTLRNRTMKKILTLSTCLILASAYSSAHAETKHDHGAHEHGIATMNIAWESNQLTIAMVSPAFNIVGFEHQPKNKKQKKFAQSVEKTLNLCQKLYSSCFTVSFWSLNNSYLPMPSFPSWSLSVTLKK